MAEIITEKELIKNSIPEYFVRRERTAAAGFAVTVCCAGWGKTSFLAQLAQDEPDSVFISFAEYDDTPERTAAVIASRTHDLSGCVTGYDAVCRFIEEAKARENGIVLIDNADAVSDRAASAFLALICEAAAAGSFRLMLAGREIPGYALPYLMNGRAQLLGIRELAFTRAETAGYLKLCGKDCTDKTVNTLYSFTDGWCAGIALIAKEAKDAGDIVNCVGRTLLRRYIGYNIIGSIDGDLAEYLKLTAFIDSQDSGFDAAVFRIGDGGMRKDLLIGRGILARSEDGGMIFPQVMRTVLAEMLPAERKRGIIERASEYYIKEKRFAEAIKLFEASGNAVAAQRILRTYGEKFLANYEFELIGYCGDIIEKESGTSDPEVLGILAQYYYYCGELSKMEAAYNMADSMFGKENRYSVCRRLYNGLMRYGANRELYTANVRSACEYLEANGLPLPFLHQRELDTLALIRGGCDDSGKLGIYRFGTLRLRVGDDEIQCKSRRSAELIAYMLENGGRPIPREDMLNMLWSDNMPANAVAMLHNIIYGLRRELSAYGLENVIIYKNKCYMLDMSMITEDDREILDICDAAEAYDRKKIVGHEKVLEKYWGRYLGTSDSRGSDGKREYYDRCFVNASLMAAENCRESNDRERELMFLKNASEIDPFSEQIVCGYIMCCFALGKPDKAKKKYDEYAVMIDEELGISPSKWLKNEFLSGFSNDSEE